MPKKANKKFRRTITKLQKFVKARWHIFLIVFGSLFILAGIGIGIYLYVVNHSPFDIVDTTTMEELDENDQFIPLVQPQGTLAATPTGSAVQLETPSSTQVVLETPTVEEKTGYIPDRIVIPVINLDAPVVPIHAKKMYLDDQTYEQWLVPNKFAAGWHETSALLGLPGNTVLNGHHNVFGKVFQYVVTLQVGDLIEVYSGSKVFEYEVAQKLLLPERWQSIEKRTENAQWIMPTTDERLTLVTCWPADSNTHRVIVVAFPRK